MGTAQRTVSCEGRGEAGFQAGDHSSAGRQELDSANSTRNLCAVVEPQARLKQFCCLSPNLTEKNLRWEG